MRYKLLALIAFTAITQVQAKPSKRINYIKHRIEVIEQLSNSISIQDQYLAEAIQAHLEAMRIAIDTGRLVTTDYDNDDISLSVERD
jgi:hypothetical protein